MDASSKSGLRVGAEMYFGIYNWLQTCLYGVVNLTTVYENIYKFHVCQAMNLQMVLIRELSVLNMNAGSKRSEFVFALIVSYHVIRVL